MEKRYKLSKFNLHCLDDEGNLLLCNFLTGIDSLSIIKKEYVKEFEEKILNSKCIIEKYNENIVQYLYKIRFLAKIDEDEDALYDALFYEKIYSGTWQLIILPTHKCNFKCKYCYEGVEFRAKEDMSYESQKKILKYIQKNSAFHSKLRVAWFGGEPLLSIKTIKYLSEGILEICDAKKINYEAEMTTNGYNMTPQVFDMLYKNKIYIYQITLDGVKKEHDKQRVKEDGMGTFDKILGNLLYIRDNRNKYKLARITIRTNATKNIMLNLKEFLDFFDEYFGSDNRFSLHFTEATQYETDMDLLDNTRLLQSDYLGRNKFLDIIYDDKYREKIITKEDIISMFTPMRSLCYAAGREKYVIDTDLAVCKCTVHFGFKENNVGYINNKGDMVIDENVNRKWYVRQPLNEECKDCFYLPCCNKTGCPHKYNFNKDEFYNHCHMENLKEKMSINLLRLAKYIKFTSIEMGD